MAKRRKKQLSVGKILSLKPAKLEKMSAKELRQLTTFLNSAANKRVKRAQQTGTKSEVLRKAMEGGRFKTTRIGKNVPESEARPIAIAEFMRVRDFLKKDTSSTRGIKKTQKKIIDKFKKVIKKLGIDLDKRRDKKEPSEDPYELGKQISEQDLNDLVWTQVDKLGETKALTKQDRYRAAAEAYDVVNNQMQTKEELFEHLQQWADDQYISDVENGVEVTDEEINQYYRGYLLTNED